MAFGPNPPPIQAHICVKDGLAAIAFYKKAFGAECPFHQLADDNKRVMHANIELFGSEVMLHDEFPEFGGDDLTRGGFIADVADANPKPACGRRNRRGPADAAAAAGDDDNAIGHHKSSTSRAGSSRLSLTRTRNVTASLPSMTR